MNQLISIGIKVLAAVGVGAAVYFGLDKVAKPKKQEPSQPRNNNCGCNNENCNCSQVNNNPNSNYSNQQSNEGQAEMRTEDKIVHGLKTAQEVCGRAFSLCQNLAVAAENIIKIFELTMIIPSNPMTSIMHGWSSRINRGIRME